MTQETLTFASSSCILLSGISLLVGWYLIRARRDIPRHKAAMLTATVLAGLFLVLYVTRWNLYGSKPFEGTGLWRTVYLGILLPHIVLAIAVGPLALRLIWLALSKKDFAAHRRLGRITAPIWLFVAGSGWAVYWLLYRVSF